ncbi:MAG: hypothetical protein ACHQK9_01040 [Reyranellales bacterium]
MKDDHVPSLGLRYWAVFMIASAFSSNAGDILAERPLLGHTGDMLVLAAALVAIFRGERYDKSKTDIWYWMAVTVIQTLAELLAENSVGNLGFTRAVLFASLAALLVTILVAARSSATLFISAHMLSRPGAAAKPMSDAIHWAAMVVASAFGSVAGDFMVVGLGVGALRSSVIFVPLMAAVLCLWRLSWTNRLLVYWLTISVICASGTVVADLLATDPRLSLGLPLSAVLNGAILVALLPWRQSRPSA